MKNFIITFAVANILAMATDSAHAQGSNNFVSAENSQNIIKIDKSVFTSPTDAEAADTKDVSAKAVKDFKRSYTNANTAVWAKTDEGFTAKFSVNNVSNIIYYGKKGNWEASLKNYDENKLDKNVRRIVKQKYYDYKITYVQEVETAATAGNPTYMIHIESDDDFKIVRINDGEMDVYEEYSKQK